MIIRTKKTSINCVTVKYVAVMLILVLSALGCSIGMLLPSTSSVELVDTKPLKGSIANVKTLAVLTTATSGGSDQLDMSKLMSQASSGSMAIDTGSGLYSPKIAEALQDNQRFRIITPYEVEKAGGVSEQILPTMTEGEKARQRAQAILNAGRSVNADGVMLVEAKKVSGTGMSMMGRQSYEYHLTVTVFSTETGTVLWKQTAIKSVNSSGINMDNTYKTVDTELLSVLVQNFNATMI